MDRPEWTTLTICDPSKDAYTPSPKTKTLNLQAVSMSVIPTSTPEPHTLHPQQQTPNTKPQSPNHRPKAQTPKSNHTPGFGFGVSTFEFQVSGSRFRASCIPHTSKHKPHSPNHTPGSRNVQRFRGGLVFKAHRLCGSLNSRLESNKEEKEPGGRVDLRHPGEDLLLALDT